MTPAWRPHRRRRRRHLHQGRRHRPARPGVVIARAVRADHPRRPARASPPASWTWSREVAAEVGARPRRARHPLHDAGRQRPARGRRRARSACSASAASPTCARRASARASTASSSRRVARLRDRERVPRRHRGPRRRAARGGARRGCEAAGATAVCVAEAFAPDGDSDERRGRRRRCRAAGLPACASSRDDRPLRPRAAGRDRGAQRVDPADRHRAPPEFVERRRRGGRHRQPGDGDARRRRRHRPRRLPARARPHALLRPGGLGRGRAARHAGRRRHRRRGRRHLDQRRRHQGAAGRPCPTCRSRATPPRVRALDVRVIGVAGGSMLRARTGRVYGVGPAQRPHRRPALRLLPRRRRARRGDRASSSRPAPGDPADYLVLRLRRRRAGSR